MTAPDRSALDEALSVASAWIEHRREEPPSRAQVGLLVSAADRWMAGQPPIAAHTTDSGEPRHEVECPGCGATIRARMADAPPPPPGYDRIASAIWDVLDSAALDVAVTEADGSPATLGRLARALDKHGLIDWNAFTDNDRRTT